MAFVTHDISDTPIEDTTAVGVSPALILSLEDMVFTILDALGSENVVQLVSTRVLIGPLADGLEHFTVDFRSLITQSRVMECPNHVVHDLVNGNTGVLPSI